MMNAERPNLFTSDNLESKLLIVAIFLFVTGGVCLAMCLEAWRRETREALALEEGRVRQRAQPVRWEHVWPRAWGEAEVVEFAPEAARNPLAPR